MPGEIRLTGTLERALHLKSVPVLAGLAPRELAALARYTRERYHAPGQTLVASGSTVDRLMVIVQGTVRATGGEYGEEELGPGRAVGFLALVSVALSWLSVAMGLSTKSVEAASNVPMPLLLLPFFGSGFVPTDSMPAGLRWFAEHQPFTPIIETLRGLLTGTAIGSSGVVAVAWCVGIAVVGWLWARRNYERRPAR